MADQAFVTLATNDDYVKGAMVLGKSLRNHETSKKLVVLVGPHVSEQSRAMLQTLYDEVRLVDVMDSGDTAHLALMQRKDLGVTLTKLHCWTLTHYSKCVFLDADTMVVVNIDELFEREELSAAPDPGWPDCFNSGVFVFQPSNETYNKLLQYCTEHGSFDGGDQGVLNGFFSDWSTADIKKHLPFTYNMSSIAIYTYLPAFKQYGANTKVVHFLGKTKPWSYTYNPNQKRLEGDVIEASTHVGYLMEWWSLYSSCDVPQEGARGTDLTFEEKQSIQGYRKLVTHPRQLWDQAQVLPAQDAKPLQGEITFTPSCTLQAVSLECMPLDCGTEPIEHGDSTQTPPETEQEEVEPQAAAPAPPPLSSAERKERWEQGQADYMGIDSFENIEKKLSSFLK